MKSLVPFNYRHGGDSQTYHGYILVESDDIEITQNIAFIALHAHVYCNTPPDIYDYLKDSQNGTIKKNNTIFTTQKPVPYSPNIEVNASFTLQELMEYNFNLVCNSMTKRRKSVFGVFKRVTPPENAAQPVEASNE